MKIVYSLTRMSPGMFQGTNFEADGCGEPEDDHTLHGVAHTQASLLLAFWAVKEETRLVACSDTHTVVWFLLQWKMLLWTNKQEYQRRLETARKSVL